MSLKHPSDPGLDHLHVDQPMLTACTVCGGLHAQRCDPPDPRDELVHLLADAASAQAANHRARRDPQEGDE